jgi:hypothetical protein
MKINGTAQVTASAGRKTEPTCVFDVRCQVVHSHNHAPRVAQERAAVLKTGTQQSVTGGLEWLAEMLAAAQGI